MEQKTKAKAKGVGTGNRDWNLGSGIDYKAVDWINILCVYLVHCLGGFSSISIVTLTILTSVESVHVHGFFFFLFFFLLFIGAGGN
jgi:hypothetical protein